MYIVIHNHIATYVLNTNSYSSDIGHHCLFGNAVIVATSRGPSQVNLAYVI